MSDYWKINAKNDNPIGGFTVGPRLDRGAYLHQRRNRAADCGSTCQGKDASVLPLKIGAWSTNRGVSIAMFDYFLRFGSGQQPLPDLVKSCGSEMSSESNKCLKSNDCFQSHPNHSEFRHSPLQKKINPSHRDEPPNGRNHPKSSKICPFQ